jgi:hypothetical protein
MYLVVFLALVRIGVAPRDALWITSGLGLSSAEMLRRLRKTSDDDPPDPGTASRPRWAS